jgi:hypothetical protein
MNTNRNLRRTDLTQAERAVLKADNLQELQEVRQHQLPHFL